MMRFNLRALPALCAIAAFGSAYADISGPTPLAWRWAESAKASPSGTPQFVGNNVIVAVGGRIYSLDKSSGNLNWRFPAGEAIQGSFPYGCEVKNGMVVAAGDEKSIYAVDAETGEMKWQYVSPDFISSNVVIAGESIGFVTGKQKVNVITAQNGQLVGQPIAEQDLVHSTIGAYQDQIIYTTQRGKMVSLDTSSLRPKWEQKFNILRSNGNFTVYGDRIYANSLNYLIALRAGTGSVIWQQNTGKELSGSPAANESGIAAMTARGEVYFFNSSGKAMFGKPVEVGVPVSSPSFVGNLVSVSTANGAINLINPQSATIVWSYVIKAITTKAPAPQTAGGGGALGPGGGDGGALGGQQPSTQPVVDYTLVAGTPAMSGNSLFVLTRDASLLMFDKDLGVDLTPPSAAMLWPKPGQEIAGKAPMEMVFKLEDLGIGIDPDSVKVKINGKDYISKLSNDGFLSVLIITRGTNAQIANGRATVQVTASDWLNNTSVTEYSLKIDNSLNALGSPPRGDSNNGNQPGGGGLGPAGGGRGGGGGRGDGS
ncbi:MAG: PQQ-binding-like beta-propeller repeat protein [Fimbriimonadaceae bacterium]|nr:MAG: PQQ-binding-like beta-propeller repeat protein [Fimbriimonadaceae bacterium]